MEGAIFIARLRTKLEAAAKRADDNFPANEYLQIEHGEPRVCSGWNSSLLNVWWPWTLPTRCRYGVLAELESLLRSHFGDWSSSPLVIWRSK